MDASSGSTQEAGYVLIDRMWRMIEVMGGRLERLSEQHNKEAILIAPKDFLAIKEQMVFAVHRLAFLELVTKGLSEMEKSDARAYAKFIESKRELEDMDIEELRVLLR